MRCETTADAQAFWDRASAFLLEDPVVNNVLITNVVARGKGAVTDPAPATFAAVVDGDKVVGAAMRTPPFHVYVSRMPADAMPPLVSALAASCPDASGVTGTVAEAESFAGAWCRLTGASSRVEQRTLIHRLDEVTMPSTPPGSWRQAASSERDLLVAWFEAFELDVYSKSSGMAAPSVDARLAEGRAFLWVDGEPVSFVGATTPAGGVVRIGPVYTPPDRRGRGYASALVAAVSQRALDDGAAACSLYTDIANPTSNKIYAAIGYRPVCDTVVHRFTSDSGPASG